MVRLISLILLCTCRDAKLTINASSENLTKHQPTFDGNKQGILRTKMESGECDRLMQEVSVVKFIW